MGEAADRPTSAPTGGGTTCANHPSRAAVGRCPTCRRLVCDECHVRIDGILHCSACLQRTARTLERRRSGVLGRIATSVAGLVLLLIAFGAVRGALTTAGFLGGRATRWFAVEFEGPQGDSK